MKVKTHFDIPFSENNMHEFLCYVWLHACMYITQVPAWIVVCANVWCTQTWWWHLIGGVLQLFKEVWVLPQECMLQLVRVIAVIMPLSLPDSLFYPLNSVYTCLLVTSWTHKEKSLFREAPCWLKKKHTSKHTHTHIVSFLCFFATKDSWGVWKIWRSYMINVISLSRSENVQTKHVVYCMTSCLMWQCQYGCKLSAELYTVFYLFWLEEQSLICYLLCSVFYGVAA